MLPGVKAGLERSENIENNTNLDRNPRPRRSQAARSLLSEEGRSYSCWSGLKLWGSSVYKELRALHSSRQTRSYFYRPWAFFDFFLFASVHLTHHCCLSLLGWGEHAAGLTPATAVNFPLFAHCPASASARMQASALPCHFTLLKTRFLAS